MRVLIEVFEQNLAAIQPIDVQFHQRGAVEVLKEVCGTLQRFNAISFRVSGFGDDEWPVDVWTDLDVVLEQLPAALLACEDPPAAFSLDFHEQGVERYLTFAPSDSDYLVTCVSYSRWTPQPAEERISVSHLREQLGALMETFLHVARVAAPGLDMNKLFQDLHPFRK